MQQAVSSLVCFSLCQCFLVLAVFNITSCWQYFENFSSKTQNGQDLSSHVQQHDLSHRNLAGNLSKQKILDTVIITVFHCLKSVRIPSYAGPHFPAFGFNTERYGISPNTDTFYSVFVLKNTKIKSQKNIYNTSSKKAT